MMVQFKHIKTNLPCFVLSTRDYKPLPTSILISSFNELPDKYPFGELSDTECVSWDRMDKKAQYATFTAFLELSNDEPFYLTYFESGFPQ